MYIIKCGNTKYEIPSQNIKFLAISKAIDLNKKPRIDTNEDAINFLKLLGCEVFENANKL